MGWVYVLEADCWGKVYKIGRTRSLETRICRLAIQLPAPVKVILTMPTDTEEILERSLHKTYSARRLNGEWFSLGECHLAYLHELAYELNQKAHGGYWMEYMDFWTSIPNSINGSGVLNEEC